MTQIELSKLNRTTNLPNGRIPQIGFGVILVRGLPPIRKNFHHTS